MSSPESKKMKLTDLPVDTITSILEQAGVNLDSVLVLANSNKTIFHIVEQWRCGGCNEPIYLATEDEKLEPHEDAEPFSCVSCSEKFCGQRRCGSYDCSGCKKVECYGCMVSHMENCGMCSKFDHHCISCQGEPDDEKFCHLCGFGICSNHGAKCEKCGVVTCGIHDYTVDTCSYCGKSLCSNCHSHGDSMWHCISCSKRSCNASGDGNPSCPRFVFGYDWPTCGRNCEGDTEDAKPKKEKKAPRKKKAASKKQKKGEEEEEDEEELSDGHDASKKGTMIGGACLVALFGVATAFFKRK